MEVVNGERTTARHLIWLESYFILTEAPQIHYICGFEKLPGSSSRNPAVQTNALHTIYCIAKLKCCIAQKSHSVFYKRIFFFDKLSVQMQHTHTHTPCFKVHVYPLFLIHKDKQEALQSQLLRFFFILSFYSFGGKMAYSFYQLPSATQHD